jgi:hypothetical protein
MSWTKILSEHELPAGGRKVIRVDEQFILVIHYCPIGVNLKGAA